MKLLPFPTRNQEDVRSAYIAGPMRGYANNNFPAFDEAAAILRGKGWNIISPADLDRDEFGYSGSGDANDALVKAMLIRDIEALTTVDAIIMLPGWFNSVGARMELTIAATLGLEIYIYNMNGSISRRNNKRILDQLGGGS